MSKERLEGIKEDVGTNARKEYEFITEILFDDALWLIEQVERAQKVEAELKGKITKKNRIIRQKDKRIKHLEWDNLVHRDAHGRLYTSMHSLREELKAKNIEVEWRY